MKRDLNLIPRADTQSTVNRYVLPIILIIVLYAATAYLAITIPQQRLQAKEDEYSTLHQKVMELEPVEAEYQLLRQRLAEIEAKKQTILRTKHSNKDALNVLALIEGACPEDIVISELSITSDGIMIAGTSENDSLVAEFMVNLRAIELFSNSNISKVEPATIDFAQVQQSLAEGTEIIPLRQFQLALAYSAAEILGEDETEAGEG